MLDECRTRGIGVSAVIIGPDDVTDWWHVDFLVEKTGKWHRELVPTLRGAFGRMKRYA